jgi:ribosome-associated heat shock protein Hsp15
MRYRRLEVYLASEVFSIAPATIAHVKHDVPMMARNNGSQDRCIIDGSPMYVYDHLRQKTSGWARPGRVSHYSCGVAGDQAGRVDSWIWSVRLARTRSAASVACRAGHVRVNGVRVKPAHAVRAGDEVRLRGEGRERVVIVQQVITKRVSASVAAGCYIDHSPPPPPREEAVPVAARDRGAGRPTKRERRSIDKLLGRPAR